MWVVFLCFGVDVATKSLHSGFFVRVFVCISRLRSLLFVLLLLLVVQFDGAITLTYSVLCKSAFGLCCGVTKKMCVLGMGWY